jgi:hypothetical protein
VITWTRAHPEERADYIYVVDSSTAHALLLAVEGSPDFQVIRAGDDGVLARILVH